MVGGQLEAGEGADGEDDHAQRVHAVMFIPAVGCRHPANVMSLRADWRIDGSQPPAAESRRRRNASRSSVAARWTWGAAMDSNIR
jgi:hypothetical protein